MCADRFANISLSLSLIFAQIQPERKITIKIKCISFCRYYGHKDSQAASYYPYTLVKIISGFIKIWLNISMRIRRVKRVILSIHKLIPKFCAGQLTVNCQDGNHVRTQ
jgi:hypothetical protein